MAAAAAAVHYPEESCKRPMSPAQGDTPSNWPRTPEQSGTSHARPRRSGEVACTAVRLGHYPQSSERPCAALRLLGAQDSWPYG